MQGGKDCQVVYQELEAHRTDGITHMWQNQEGEK